MQSFEGRTAVVTGAGSGIGRALASRFAAEGMSLAIADIDDAGLHDTETLIRAASGESRVLSSKVDVGDAAAVDAFADTVFDQLGRVHVVCNNAGVFGGGYLWELSDAELSFVHDVNVRGVVNGVRSFVPRMIAGGDEGHILNTSSVSGLFGAPTSGAYAMSKFAVVAATEALAGDLALIGSPLGASVLCPGLVRTDIAVNARRRLDGGEAPVSDGQRFVTDLLLGMVPGGIDPSDVASLVIDAIRSRTFLILTDPHHAEMLSARTADLVAGRVPAIPDFT